MLIILLDVVGRTRRIRKKAETYGGNTWDESGLSVLIIIASTNKEVQLYTM